MSDQRNVTLAVTGAGGTRIARLVLEALVNDDRVGQVDLLVSAAGRKLIAHETGRDSVGEAVELLLGGPSPKVVSWDPVDLAGGPTSGSYPSWGMLVAPCALGAVGRIAAGTANTLIERAADVTLKERRPLVLCVRETPFNLIHLRTMTQVTEAGATVYPDDPDLLQRAGKRGSGLCGVHRPAAGFLRPAPNRLLHLRGRQDTRAPRPRRALTCRG